MYSTDELIKYISTGPILTGSGPGLSISKMRRQPQRPVPAAVCTVVPGKNNEEVKQINEGKAIHIMCKAA